MTAFWFWLRFNASSAHLRFMARWLRRKSWVVFYLEPRYRQCGPGFCWLQEYQAGEKKR